MSFSAVVVAQLAAGLLPTPEIHILNEAIRNFLTQLKYFQLYVKNGQFPATFSIFSAFQYS